MSHTLTQTETEDLANTLFSDAFVTILESEWTDTNNETLGELFRQVSYPQADLTETVPALMRDLGIRDHLTESIDLVRKIEAKIEERTLGRLTLADLYRHNQTAAHREILGAVGHGVSADDDKAVSDWIKSKGVDPSVLHRLYFESVYPLDIIERIVENQ